LLKEFDHRFRYLKRQPADWNKCKEVGQVGRKEQRVRAIDLLVIMHPHKPGTITSLSKRERQVLELIGESYTSKDVAANLGISIETVSGYRKQICQKLGLHSTAELIAYAVRELEPPNNSTLE
jgi:DNA-binding CsgD family transcriptional regulator